MYTAPASTSSRPASIRKAVDLPEPDGPTSTISSPSASSRSSAWTAGSSLPANNRLACSKRTSAMVHPSKLGADPLLRAVGRAEPVEPEQGRADDRRRVHDAHLGVRRLGENARGYGLDQPRRAEAHQASAQHHVHGLVAELEPAQRRGGERDDLG